MGVICQEEGDEETLGIGFAVTKGKEDGERLGRLPMKIGFFF